MSNKIITKIEFFLPPVFQEGVANRINELEIGGVEIVEEKSTCILRTYIEGQDKSEHFINQMKIFLDSMKEIFPNENIEAKIVTSQIDSEDWAHAWKKYFKPLVISERLVIKPSWESFEPNSSQFVIEIDPEMAFGTGGHETTRLCLENMDTLFAENTPETFLDVGTGTGLLAIAAAKLGTKTVLGIDVDPLAVETAQRNSKINGVDSICQFSSDDISVLTGTYDFIAANITSDVLCRIVKDIANRQTSGGFLLLTGIVNENAEQVKKCYTKAGYADFKQKIDNEWTIWSAKMK